MKGEIKELAHVARTDMNVFTNEVADRIWELQAKKLEVEIQYQMAPITIGIQYSAIIMGREHK